MTSADGFIAPPFKRYTAFFIDALVVLLIFGEFGVPPKGPPRNDGR